MITRAVVLQNATTTGTTCDCSGGGAACGLGVIKDLGGRACDVVVYGGIQLFSSTAGGIKLWLQGNSSSGFTTGVGLNPGVDIMAFTSRSCRDSQFQRIPWNCTSATSTHRSFYRLAFSQTCAQTNLFLGAISVE